MRSSLLRILALIQKEFLAVLKDPRSRIIIFLPPMLQCLVFGYAASFDLNSVPYAVMDQDHSAASTAFLSRLDGSGIFQRQADLVRVKDISTWINSRRALLVIRIDQDFERHLLAGKPAQVQVTADVKLESLHTHKLLFSNSNYVFREEYQVSESPSALFEEDKPALERLSHDLARTLVTDILENF